MIERKTAVSSSKKIEKMLVSSYSSSSSSSSESSEDESSDVVTKKRKRKDDDSLGDERRKKKDLPLPSCFQTKEKAEKSVDIDGKVRNFPHVEGNWPSHIYVKVSSESLKQLSEDVVKLMNSHLSSSKDVVVHPMDQSEYHVSLSRPFVLRHHHIDPFVKALRKALREVKRFKYTFEDFKVFTNDENTRSFGSIMISEGKTEFIDLIRKIDSVLIDFRATPYYESPQPHVSVAWHSGPCPSTIKTGHTKFTTKETDSFQALEVVCKIGNKSHIFPLVLP